MLLKNLFGCERLREICPTVLAMAGKTVPEVLIALGAAAIGALAGLLAPSLAHGGWVYWDAEDRGGIEVL